MSYNVGQQSVLDGQQFYMTRATILVSTELISISSLQRKKAHTLPSEASSNFTGLSRTDAKKQNDEGLLGEAVGNQVKSSIGADCCKIKFGRAGTPGL